MVGANSVYHSIYAVAPKVAAIPWEIYSRRRLACTRTSWLKARMVPVR